MKKSFLERTKELDALRRVRVKLYTLIAKLPNTHLVIGGSYALKVQCACFDDRECNDFDFIVHCANEEAFRNTHSALHDYVQCGMLKFAEENLNKEYAYTRYILPGGVLGKKAEILVRIVDHLEPGLMFEKPLDIIKIKRQWVGKFIAARKEPRQKDLDDINTWDLNETEELPF